jgi:hypothetical protein
VKTAKGAAVGDAAAPLGRTPLNLVALFAGEQGTLPAAARPVTLIVDELQTMPGPDYESILSELATFGGGLVLSTQSLGRLEAPDRDRHRDVLSWARPGALDRFTCASPGVVRRHVACGRRRPDRIRTRAARTPA